MNRIVLLFAVLTGSAMAADNAPIPVAIFPFDFPHKGKDYLVTDSFTAALTKDRRFTVLERANLDKAIKEQALGLSGEIDPGTAASVGRLTGAKILIFGRHFGNTGIHRAGEPDHTTLIVRIVGVYTGRVFTETGTADYGYRSVLEKLSVQLAGQVEQSIMAHAPELMVAMTTREERIAAIVGLATGPHRPAVAIRIHEQRVGRAGVMSTVETELGYVFQRAGFVVVDDQSARKPDFEIEGEATSGTGQPRGTLIPGRATLEVKVRERLTGKLLLIDREDGEALDVAEATAVNAALADAAESLAAKLVPLLNQ